MATPNGESILRKNAYAAALAKRQKQSAIACRMMLTILKAAHKNFHTKHLGAMFEEYLVGMTLSAEGAPMTIAEIARALNMPRSNAQRGADSLIRFGMCLKTGRTLVINPDYYAERADDDSIVAIQEAIFIAARELAKLDGSGPPGQRIALDRALAQLHSNVVALRALVKRAQ